MYRNFKLQHFQSVTLYLFIFCIHALSLYSQMCVRFSSDAPLSQVNIQYIKTRVDSHKKKEKCIQEQGPIMKNIAIRNPIQKIKKPFLRLPSDFIL